MIYLWFQVFLAASEFNTRQARRTKRPGMNHRSFLHTVHVLNRKLNELLNWPKRNIVTAFRCCW